jgi:hypothetical protein
MGEAMEPTRGLTVHFTDGTKMSYGFPEQGKNAAAKQMILESFMKSPYLLVIADGVLTMLPVANIKALQMPWDESMQGMNLPQHVIRGATVTRGDL